MADCEHIRPLLFPYIEREAEPAEAMLVAEHLAACTACKILIARKHRLARMLESGLEDRIPVGEEFVRSVMATLPEGPPPVAGKPRDKRGLRLAGTLAIVFGLAPAVAGRLPAAAADRLGLELAGLGPQGGVVETALGLLRGAAVAIAARFGGAPPDLAIFLPSAGSVAFVAALALGALAASGGVLALAAGSILGSRRA